MSVNLSGFLIVALAAVLGAWLRWLLGVSLNGIFASIPLGTLVVNLAGGYMMGLFMGFTSAMGEVSPELRLFITTGFLGTLTTFSAFSGEAVSLLARGEYGWGIAHLLLHVVGSLLMTVLGIMTVNLVR